MKAREIVQNWMTNQLRPEGREGIYTDDEVGLICDIEQSLLAERKAALLEAAEKDKCSIHGDWLHESDWECAECQGTGRDDSELDGDCAYCGGRPYRTYLICDTCEEEAYAEELP